MIPNISKNVPPVSQYIPLVSAIPLRTLSRIVPGDKVMAESGFEPNISLEFKLVGPQNAQRLVIRNRGPKKLTTLQERMDLRQKKRWKTMALDY